MKYFAILLSVLTVLVVTVVLITAFTTSVVVEGYSLTPRLATDALSTFDALKAAVNEHRLIGTIFDASPMGKAEDYVFFSYTLRLRNDCLIRMDMIEVQIVPAQGDVLQYALDGTTGAFIGETRAKSLPARSKGDITVYLLSKAQSGTHGVREILITYYIWGTPYTVRTTYGQ